MDIDRVKNHFKSYTDEQLQWHKEQYEFDISIEGGFLIEQENKSGAKIFLKLVNEEIEYRKNDLRGDR